MYGKQVPEERITPEEAIILFSFAKIEEILRAMDLYDIYRQHQKIDTPFDIMRMLAFIYDTGRVQGIREERARHK